VAAQEAPRQVAAVPRPQGAAVLPPLRHRAVVARAGVGLRHRPDQHGVRDVPAGGRPRAPARRVDHDAVDAALQRGRRRAPRPRVRRVRARGGALHRRRGAGGRRQGARHAAHQRNARRRLPGPRPRRQALRAPARGRAAAAGGPARRDHRDRVRVRRRRDRDRPHGARLRRRRLRGGAAARPRVRQSRRARRHVPGHALAGDQRQARHRQGDQRGYHRASEARRPLARDAPAHAHLPVLLALRFGPHLLRPHVVVRAHHGVQGAPPRGEWRGGLAPPRGGHRPLRRVAREQRRLGAVPRPLLGHAAQHLGMRPRPRAPRGHRRVRGARRALGEDAAGSAAAPCAACPR